MNKLYDRIDFVNNTTPALNETNLDLMSKAIDDIDDRVIEIAGDVLVVVPEILDKYADIEALATNPPYVGQNGHWWTWDTDLNQYVDSGVDAGVSVTVGTTTTLPAGSDATVTNSGTDTDPILNFGIPQGVAGQDGVSPEVTITTITDGHTVTITDKDHPTGQSFNVMDGQDGAPGVGVPSGGTTGQVLKKVSGTDYDTEWANESGGGSGGHTIINSSGTSMTQRTGLQFEDMGVTDDSVNDKTVVTLPTPDYVDAQYSSSTTYSKGMTCIEGNLRYRYKNSTATSGHRPPDTTYWEVFSVASEIKNPPETLLWDSGWLQKSNFTWQSDRLRYYYTTSISLLSSYPEGFGKLWLKITVKDSSNTYRQILVAPLYYNSADGEGKDHYIVGSATALSSLVWTVSIVSGTGVYFMYSGVSQTIIDSLFSATNFVKAQIIGIK